MRLKIDVMVDGTRLREIRISLHLTISALSKRSGVNRDLISSIERGFRPSTRAPVDKLFATLTELLAYHDDPACHAEAEDE